MPAVKLSQILQNKTDIAALVSGSTAAAKATKLSTARYIDGLSFDGSANINHYATCATAAETAAKVATLSGYSLQTGGRAMIKFTYNNTAAAPTLNINATGAKAIKAFGTTESNVQWVAGDVVEVIYDGTNYSMLPTMGMIKILDDAVDTLNTSLNGLDAKVTAINTCDLLASNTGSGSLVQTTISNINVYKLVILELTTSSGMLISTSTVGVSRFKTLNSAALQMQAMYATSVAASCYYSNDTSVFLGTSSGYVAKLYGIK